MGQEAVYQRIECQTVHPTTGEITNIDFGIVDSLHLAPEQEWAFRRCQTLRLLMILNGRSVRRFIHGMRVVENRIILI